MTMPETDSASATYVGTVTLGGDRSINEAAISHPISADEANAEAQRLIGLVSTRVFLQHARRWWDKLAADGSPEEKLTCERMITAYLRASGMNDFENARRIAADNNAAAASYARIVSEQRAIDRWRR